jgi:hypothetical protein
VLIALIAASDAIRVVFEAQEGLSFWEAALATLYGFVACIAVTFMILEAPL